MDAENRNIWPQMLYKLQFLFIVIRNLIRKKGQKPLKRC